MKIVIDIPDRIYKISQNRTLNIMDAEILENAVKNGIPFPKGYGKLIDSTVLWDAYQDLGQDFYEAVDFAEANAIIEADEEA